MPDSSAAMDRSYQEDRARRIELNNYAFLIHHVAPTVRGSVVEVWRDRLACLVDAESPLPLEGSPMALFDHTGFKADVYVVRVRGRLALTQLTPVGSRRTPAVGDRTTGKAR